MKKLNLNTAEKIPVWNLSYIYNSKEEKHIFDYLDIYIKKAKLFNKKYQNKISKLTSINFLKALKVFEGLVENSILPLRYLDLKHSTDLNNQTLITQLGKAQNLYSIICKKLEFFENETAKIPLKKKQTLLKDKNLTNYKNFLSQIFKSEKHILAKELELLLIDTDLNSRSAWKDFRDIYESKLKFKFKAPGDKVEREYLQPELINIASKHKDEAVRLAALETLMGKYKEHAYVFSFIYNSIIQDMIKIDKERRGYSPLINKRNLSNELTNKQVTTMLESVKDHYYIAQNYWKLKAKILKIKNFKSSDVYAGLNNVENKKYSFSEISNMVFNSLEIFDKNLAELFKEAIKNNLIHAKTISGKRGGAFCASVSTKHAPLVLMNFTGQIQDASTLSHEMGHWLHDVLTITMQTKLNCNPPLTTCETASVYNEILLFSYLKNELKNNKVLLLNYLMNKMDSIIATVFRQSAFSLFEQEVFKLSERAPLTEDDFSNIFEKNYKELYGTAVKLTPTYKYQWAYVPHFMHTPFYVYAYSFGELATISLYTKYLSSSDKPSFVKKYKNFLSMGSSLNPQDLYKTMGIDINKKATWNAGFKFIESIYEEIKKISSLIIF